MKFTYASDLHLDFHDDKGKALVESLPHAEIIILAGDVSNFPQLWDSLMLFLKKYQEVVYVFGNHDFWYSNMGKVRSSLNKLLFRAAKLRKQGHTLGNLHILDNSTVTLGGQRFVGTTMWFRKLPGLELSHHLMNDFDLIGKASLRIYQENEKALAFLEETVRPSDVVITHHAPSFKSLSPSERENEYAPFYACDVEDLILRKRPLLWIHGHIHESVDYLVGGTSVRSNPFGYWGRKTNPKFRYDIRHKI